MFFIYIYIYFFFILSVLYSNMSSRFFPIISLDVIISYINMIAFFFPVFSFVPSYFCSFIFLLYFNCKTMKYAKDICEKLFSYYLYAKDTYEQLFLLLILKYL